MAAYRLYCLDGANHFTHSADFEASGDEEAIRRAQVLMGESTKAEIWDRNRLVARLSPETPQQGDR